MDKKKDKAELRSESLSIIDGDTNIEEVEDDLFEEIDIESISESDLVLVETINNVEDPAWERVHSIDFSSYEAPLMAWRGGVKSVPATIKSFNQEFLQWFVGFTDAEATFYLQYFPDRVKIRLVFSITVKKDDNWVLVNIRNNLNIGNIYDVRKKDCSVYAIYDQEHIKDIIIPIFETYPLLTSKSLNFKYFKQAMAVTWSYRDKKLDQRALIQCLDYKNSMNKKLKAKEIEEWNTANAIYGQRLINPYWLVGFTEGDGSFGLSQLKPSFTIGQKGLNNDYHSTLTVINHFLSSLASSNTLLYMSPVEKMVSNISKTKKKNYWRLTISGVGSLYWYILPFFWNSKFYSRKEIDFKLWAVIVILGHRGVASSPEGRRLVDVISQNINKKRYSDYVPKDTEVFHGKLNIDSINLQLGLNRGDKPSGPVGPSNLGHAVWVLDNGKLIQNPRSEAFESLKALTPSDKLSQDLVLDASKFSSHRDATRRILEYSQVEVDPNSVGKIVNSSVRVKGRFSFISNARLISNVPTDLSDIFSASHNQISEKVEKIYASDADFEWDRESFRMGTQVRVFKRGVELTKSPFRSYREAAFVLRKLGDVACEDFHVKACLTHNRSRGPYTFGRV